MQVKHLCLLIKIKHRNPSPGSPHATTPYSCHSVFTDRSIFSLNLSRIQIPTGTSVTNWNQKHGLGWNWPISWEKISKNRLLCKKFRCIGLWWELQAPSNGLLRNIDKNWHTLIFISFHAGEDFHEHTAIFTRTVENQMNEDKPGTINKKTMFNDGSISSSNSLFCSF